MNRLGTGIGALGLLLTMGAAALPAAAAPPPVLVEFCKGEVRTSS